MKNSHWQTLIKIPENVFYFPRSHTWMNFPSRIRRNLDSTIDSLTWPKQPWPAIHSHELEHIRVHERMLSHVQPLAQSAVTHTRGDYASTHIENKKFTDTHTYTHQSIRWTHHTALTYESKCSHTHNTITPIRECLDLSIDPLNSPHVRPWSTDQSAVTHTYTKRNSFTHIRDCLDVSVVSLISHVQFSSDSGWIKTYVRVIWKVHNSSALIDCRCCFQVANICVS